LTTGGQNRGKKGQKRMGPQGAKKKNATGEKGTRAMGWWWGGDRETSNWTKEVTPKESSKPRRMVKGVGKPFNVVASDEQEGKTIQTKGQKNPLKSNRGEGCSLQKGVFGVGARKKKMGSSGQKRFHKELKKIKMRNQKSGADAKPTTNRYGPKKKRTNRLSNRQQVVKSNACSVTDPKTLKKGWRRTERGSTRSLNRGSPKT